ncbi:Hypothetical predicted protein [Drosophila guanche]|uniref:Uncharacterized protein n=2 Tax=Drosophila guanche TaxID=7266 RepID=A0A3B0K1K9_DROGU|nr:Hypothetical predicted protein [Drosophila guanche]
MATQDDGRSATSGVLGLTDEVKANGRCSFVIALNSEGQLEISPKEAGIRAEQGAEQRQDRICSGICSVEDKIKAEKVQAPAVNSQRISIALIKHDPDAFDSLQVASDVSCQRNSSMGFVKVFNGEDLRRKPSFVVLEEALVRKRMEQSSESSVNSVQQETRQSKMKTQTEESPKDVPQNSRSSNRSPSRFNRRNAGMQQYQGDSKVASKSTLLPEATRPTTATHSHKPTEQQTIHSSTPSHGTFSFVPASPAQSVNPMMYPCQQFLNNNMAIPYLNGCNCCNCCPFRQVAPDGCCNCSSCCALSYASNCCPLRPPAGAAAGAASASVPQMQPSLSYCQPNLYAMPMVTQQMFTPLLQSTREQQQQQYPFGWYPYPPSAPCHSMQQCFCQPMTTNIMGSNCCRMNAAYHPCPHCGSFVNSPQMQHKTQHQNQETQSVPCVNQQHQETQSVPCGNQRQRRYPIKRAKVPDSSDASSSPVNREELRRMFGPSSTQQQPRAKQQVKSSSAKESTAIPAKETRSLAGRSESTSMGAGKQTTSLYMARFGRTCMLMKPSSTSTSMPRLLTRRISRYTSVMAWPTNHKLEHN